MPFPTFSEESLNATQSSHTGVDGSVNQYQGGYEGFSSTPSLPGIESRPLTLPQIPWVFYESDKGFQWIIMKSVFNFFNLIKQPSAFNQKPDEIKKGNSNIHLQKVYDKLNLT